MKLYKKLFVVPAIIFWIVVWHYWSKRVGNGIFLPSPEKTFHTMLILVREKTFFQTLIHTIGNIMKGFFYAVIAGFVLGTLASFFRLLQILTDTLMNMIKAVPVASFTILALLFIKSEHMAVLVSFLIVTPSIYTNVMTGYHHVEHNMKEMSGIYGVPVIRRIRYMYLPEVLPALLAACQTGVGLAYKSGVSAEVIAQTTDTIGYELYQSKIYLDTERLFAWTILVILLSALVSWIVKMIFAGLNKIVVKSHSIGGLYRVTNQIFAEEKKDTMIDFAEKKEKALKLLGVSKTYQKQKIIENMNIELHQGDVIAVMGESGIGKTTLGNLITGVVRADSGEIIKENLRKTGVVFQENRLFENSDIYTNMYYATGKQAVSRQQYDEILERLELNGYGRTVVSKLSGGMKRRVSIARALLIQPDILILDEPFNGLDRQLAYRVIDYIKETNKNRITVLITHNCEEAERMGAEIIEINKKERE